MRYRRSLFLVGGVIVTAGIERLARRTRAAQKAKQRVEYAFAWDAAHAVQEHQKWMVQVEETKGDTDLLLQITPPPSHGGFEPDRKRVAVAHRQYYMTRTLGFYEEASDLLEALGETSDPDVRMDTLNKLLDAADSIPHPYIDLAWRLLETTPNDLVPQV